MLRISESRHILADGAKVPFLAAACIVVIEKDIMNRPGIWTEFGASIYQSIR